MTYQEENACITDLIAYWEMMLVSYYQAIQEAKGYLVLLRQEKKTLPQKYEIKS